MEELSNGTSEEHTKPGVYFAEDVFRDELSKRNSTNLDALHSFLKNGSKTRLVLIKGPEGSGKTMLTRSLENSVKNHGGYCLPGRFDRIGVMEPFVAFVRALTAFATQVSPNSRHLSLIRDHDVFRDGTGQVLTEVIRKLKVIFEVEATANSPTSTNTPIWKGTSQPFLYALRAFLRAVSSIVQNKLVLFLDDLQFADPCSLDLLVSLVDDDDMDGLLIVACWDSSASFNISEKTKWHDERICTIEQQYLSPEELQSILSATLVGPDDEELRTLSQSLFHVTKGNLLFLTELLPAINEHASSDFLAQGKGFRSELFQERLSSRLITSLTNDELKILKVASVFGSSIDEYVVSKAVGETVSEVRDTLNIAMDRGYIILEYDMYVFAHPAVQELVYNLIPENERELFHLDVGRKLWRHFDTVELDLYAFQILSQYDLARKHIHKELECKAVASLCLVAGRKAAKACTFRCAAAYLNFGIELLKEKGWDVDYELTLSLYNTAAEMELCNANYDKMNILLDTALSNAKSVLDRIQAYTTRIYYLGIIDEQMKAIALGLDILRQLGEKFPKRFHVMHILHEFTRARHMVKRKSNEQLLRARSLVDSNKIARLQILQMIFPYVLIVRPHFSPLVQLRMIRITLKDGLSVFASLAYVSFGILNMAISGDYVEGVRLGQLAIELVAKYQAIEYIPRVYAFYYGFIHGWKFPFPDSYAPLLKGYEVGQQTGDFVFSAMCATCYCFAAIGYGVCLNEVADKWLYFQRKLIDRRHKAVLHISLPPLKNVFRFAGLPLEPLESAEMDAVLGTPQNPVFQELNIRTADFVRHCLYNEYKEAFEKRLSKRDYMMLPPSFIRFELKFLSSTLYTAMAREDARYRVLIRAARRLLKQIKRLALLTPQNALAKRYLVEAEIASVSGDETKASAEYFHSITLAEHEGTFMYGFANERAARHYLSKGDLSKALPYFQQSCRGYQLWGAVSKVDLLKAEMSNIFSPDQVNSMFAGKTELGKTQRST